MKNDKQTSKNTMQQSLFIAYLLFWNHQSDDSQQKCQSNKKKEKHYFMVYRLFVKTVPFLRYHRKNVYIPLLDQTWSKNNVALKGIAYMNLYHQLRGALPPPPDPRSMCTLNNESRIHTKRGLRIIIYFCWYSLLLHVHCSCLFWCKIHYLVLRKLTIYNLT